MKSVLILFLTSMVVGCAANNDMLDNQYSVIMPTPTKIAGNWTGNNGPFLVTYQFNADGTGLTCYSYNGKDVVEKFKVNGDQLIVQSGLKQTITENTYEKLTLKAKYYMGATYTYRPDPELQLASPYCGKALHK